MAGDTKTSALTQIGTPKGTTDIPIEDAGASLRMTVAQLQGTPIVLGVPRGISADASVLSGWVATIPDSLAITGTANLTVYGTGELAITDERTAGPNLYIAGRA